MRVAEMFPELALELRRLLTERGEMALASQIPELELLDLCRCGDAFCATIYTTPKPVKRYGPNHRSFDLDAESGVIILDAVDARIVCIEILNRDDVRRKLLESLP
jgi:hypothetical protein